MRKIQQTIGRSMELFSIVTPRLLGTVEHRRDGVSSSWSSNLNRERDRQGQQRRAGWARPALGCNYFIRFLSRLTHELKFTFQPTAQLSCPHATLQNLFTLCR